MTLGDLKQKNMLKITYFNLFYSYFPYFSQVFQIFERNSTTWIKPTKIASQNQNIVGGLKPKPFSGREACLGISKQDKGT